MIPLYEDIGGSYSATRKQDPRIAALIKDALGDARSVVNVGAGTGAYEPTDREVLAVEPSETMIAQRPHGSAPVIRASAENLPLPDGSYDAALAVSTVHHWTDLRAGLHELRRVARQRVVIFLRDPESGTPFWLTEDYLPSLDPSRRISAIVEAIEAEFRSVQALPVRLLELRAREGGRRRTRSRVASDQPRIGGLGSHLRASAVLARTRPRSPTPGF